MDYTMKRHFQDPEILAKYANTRDMLNEYNRLPYMDFARKGEIIRSLFGSVGKSFRIEAPFCCDFGGNIFLGENVFINFNCTILDCSRVEIGEDTIIAPNVQIYAVGHPLDPGKRWEINEAGEKCLAATLGDISIGRNCWIGGGVVIVPGVSIGDNCTIGAGSVVTKNIPSNSVAAGNPCKVLRSV